MKRQSDVVNLVNHYNMYIKGLTDVIDEWCEKDIYVDKFIHAIYYCGDYEVKDFDYYMYIGMEKILKDINVNLSSCIYGWPSRTESYNVVERLYHFIEEYIHTENTRFLCNDFKNKTGVKFTLTFNEFNLPIISAELKRFFTEKRMYSEGYTNKASDYIKILEEYASKTLEVLNSKKEK